MGNFTGQNFRIVTFGESHGLAMGLVIDGLPAGLVLNADDIQKDLDRRRPGQSPFTTPRKELDQCQILSGLSNGSTTGSPLALLVYNTGAKKSDYEKISDRFRPGHADWPYFIKYGLTPQPGGGRASGRETLSRVAAGAVARKLLKPLGVTVKAASLAIGSIKAQGRNWDFAENDPLRFLDPNLSADAGDCVTKAMKNGDSVGAVVEVLALGVPAGWGDPVFDKLEARLGGAFFSIGAVRAVEFGEGLLLASKLGSESNDPLGPHGPLTNRHGGIMGGISTANPIVARLFIKPTPSISIDQDTIDIKGNPVKIIVKGRHDPCLAPRLAPVAEAMCLITLADFYLSGPSKL
jgi:chorismate synthase